MGGDCDGGGNRHLSQVDLKQNKQLQNYFENRAKVHAGICSIQLKNDEEPWIVCPRRLLVLGRKNAIVPAHQTKAHADVLSLLGYSSGTRIGVWSEVKLQFKERTNKAEKTFNYTFDYLIVPIGRMGQSQLEQILGNDWARWRRVFTSGGYSISREEDQDFVEDCPMGVPRIIEIMTCSTSGGNKTKRTRIPDAFEDAILGKQHEAPGINKRQVWARMVSQLIVKSEVAMGWGGKALWIIQDALADYISTSTALDLRQFISDHISEVNLLSFSYADQYPKSSDVIELRDHRLFAGPISSGGKEAGPSFQDMIRAPIRPSLNRLFARLAKNKHIAQIQVP